MGRSIIATRRVDITTAQPLSIMSVDIIGDLCGQFADSDLFAVCAALGVPARDWPSFARWATDFLNPKSVEELYAHLDVMVAERCAMPGRDLLSDLIGLEVDGDGLTVDELHTIVAVLLAGAKVGCPATG